MQKPYKYISTNMLSLLHAVGNTSKPVKVRTCHTLTLAALYARGAVVFKPRKGFVQVSMTPAGKNLLDWADTAELTDYRKKALPAAQAEKKRMVT